eukprot:5045841-Pyramimonas_sp.AAC.1
MQALSLARLEPKKAAGERRVKRQGWPDKGPFESGAQTRPLFPRDQPCQASLPRVWPTAPGSPRRRSAGRGTAPGGAPCSRTCSTPGEPAKRIRLEQHPWNVVSPHCVESRHAARPSSLIWRPGAC